MRYFVRRAFRKMLKPFLPDPEKHIRKDGPAAVMIGSRVVRLDLSNIHERRYIIAEMFNRRHPPHDIDVMLTEKFVRPGDVVLDAGANIGVTAAYFLARGASHVTAVEPEPNLAARVKLIDPSIEVLNAALSDEVGEIDLVLSTTHNQGHTIEASSVKLFPEIFGSDLNTVKVPVTTVDTAFAGTRFDMWKVDVEGSELKMIAGAAHTLAAAAPRCIIMEAYGENGAKAAELLKATHPYQYRALIDRGPYQLTLLPVSAPVNVNQYEGTAPMYVFASEPA